MPKLTVAMNRADPFFERDATGWQFIDFHNGNVDVNYTLYDNTNRVIAFNETTGRPEDLSFQNPNARVPAQTALLSKDETERRDRCESSYSHLYWPFQSW